MQSDISTEVREQGGIVVWSAYHMQGERFD